ncbi:ATP-binding cassette domain-containing protein [Pelagibacterium montanilacus]|uniref:ATP-binding cassette domain-containing protein n=1 Tax=Pelagibacterium montanilacus TaxID=2185280 RepID=UPI000F8DFD8E|nr:ATP-binding cassette domain-containing protein [Pelagibacterium montanilacus]
MTATDTSLQTPARAGNPGSENLLVLTGITKSYGPTLANAQIDLAVRRGEVLGLVGGNGAGKSTLMRIVCGATPPTLGAIAIAGEEIALASYDAGAAQARGIRMVHQELSLCTNLSVAENFFLEAPEGATAMPGWRARYAARARAALDEVFPENSIDINAPVGQLEISERQMAEIARAAATPGVRLIILDEPTSSLGPERSRQLREYVHKRAAQGVAFIFISHKLREIVEIASSVAVLRNGQLVARSRAAETSVDLLVELMGGRQNATETGREALQPGARDTMVRIEGPWLAGRGSAITLGKGEIIGLAGLEGSGQARLLHAIFSGAAGVRREAEASFVAGDRAKEGIFPLWDVLSNITIGRIAKRAGGAWISTATEKAVAGDAASSLRLDAGRLGSGITELSGGNQQKALVARALVADAPIILLDDPTRGVDIATKQDFYALVDEIAASGRTVVWHTTEDRELLAADRVLVFSDNRIVRELSGAEISEASIIDASFSGTGGHGTAGADRPRRVDWKRHLVTAMPYFSLAVVLALMIEANPLVASSFGLDLLLMPAVALVLVAIAQMFVVGGSEIDLGVGAFAGLVSVLSATLLFDHPLVGAGAIILAILAYSALGGLIQARKIPAIVVTLGASFIWLGIGLSIQPTPGGSSPAWLSAMVNWSVGGIPTAIVMLVVIAIIAWAIDRTPLGVVLRGFGNNPGAMVMSGWHTVRYGVVRYLLAGLFASTAGMLLTALNTASDINSGNSYTLLSVAAVVMGGCALFGGIISPIGVVVGAVTLSLIGALLGILNVSSDFNAATQGAVLLAILAVRSLASRGREDT